MQITQARCILCTHKLYTGYYCCYKDRAICQDCCIKKEKCPKCHKQFKFENTISSADILKKRCPKKHRADKMLYAKGYHQCCQCYQHKYYEKQMFLEVNCNEKICQKCIRQSLSHQQISEYAILPCRDKCKYSVTQITLFLKDFCLRCMKNCQYDFYDLMDKRKICGACLSSLKRSSNMEDIFYFDSIKKLMLHCANCERQIENQRKIGFHEGIIYICKLCCDLNRHGQEMRERNKDYQLYQHQDNYQQYRKRKCSISPKNPSEYKKQTCNQCLEIIHITQESYNWKNRILCSLCYSNMNQSELKKSSLNYQKSIINMNSSQKYIEMDLNQNNIKSDKERTQNDNYNKIQFQYNINKLKNNNINKYNAKHNKDNEQQQEQQQQHYFQKGNINNYNHNSLKQKEQKDKKQKLCLSSKEYSITINTNDNNNKVKQYQQQSNNINSMKNKEYTIQPNYYQQVSNEAQEQEQQNRNQDNRQENKNIHISSKIHTIKRRIQQSQIINNINHKSELLSEIQMNEKVYCEKCGKGMNISIAIWEYKNGQEIVICNECQLNVSVNQ